MRHGALAIGAYCVAAAVTLCAPPCFGGHDSPAGAAPALVAPDRPLMLQQDSESIYALPEVPREDEGINQGGVNLDLTVNYMTDYVFRGVERSEAGSLQGAAEDAPNLQFDGKLAFNLGRLPHPVLGVFVNVYNDDPVSRFQEVRPYFGIEWNIKPLTLSAGQASYIFPEREDSNTAEIYARIELDDSLIWGAGGTPFLSPYVFAAYDYDLYDGLYIEAGVRHDFPIEGTGIVVTALADIGYGVNYGLFSTTDPGGFGPIGATEDSGFQHYDIGLVGTYSLNTLLNVPRRYGEWRLKGYLFYTDGIDNALTADTQLWGGVGINFKY